MSDSNKVAQLIDHKRWLLNNGLADNGIKNDLFMYGAICHPKVLAVNLDVDFLKKTVFYDLYFDETVLKRIEKFKALAENETIFNLWRLKRMVKKYGNLHVDQILHKFINDYAGPQWTSTINIHNVAGYKPEDKEMQRGEAEVNKFAYQQVNQER